MWKRSLLTSRSPFLNRSASSSKAHTTLTGKWASRIKAIDMYFLLTGTTLLTRLTSMLSLYRSRLTANILQYLSQMPISDAISTIIPVLQGLSADAKDSIREVLASQLDKIVLHFFQHTRVRTDEETQAKLSIAVQGQDTIITQELTDPSTLPHNAFTPIFINLLLDQNAGIAHQTRQAVVTVAENISEDLLEREILNGIVNGLERLYETTGEGSTHVREDSHDPFLADNNEEQDGEAELGKMLVVVVSPILQQYHFALCCVLLFCQRNELMNGCIGQNPVFIAADIVGERSWKNTLYRVCPAQTGETYDAFAVLCPQGTYPSRHISLAAHPTLMPHCKQVFS